MTVQKSLKPGLEKGTKTWIRNGMDTCRYPLGGWGLKLLQGLIFRFQISLETYFQPPALTVARLQIHNTREQHDWYDDPGCSKRQRKSLVGQQGNILKCSADRGLVSTAWSNRTENKARHLQDQQTTETIAIHVKQQEDKLQTDELTPEFNMYVQQQEDKLQTDELTPEFNMYVQQQGRHAADRCTDSRVQHVRTTARKTCCRQMY